MKEQHPKENKAFTSWLLLFGKLDEQSSSFQLIKVDELKFTMSAVLNGRVINFVFHPGENNMTWSVIGTQDLSHLAGNGWSYAKRPEPSGTSDFECLTSQKIDLGTKDAQIIIGRHPGKGDVFVLQTSVAKSLPSSVRP